MSSADSSLEAANSATAAAAAAPAADADADVIVQFALCPEGRPCWRFSKSGWVPNVLACVKSEGVRKQIEAAKEFNGWYTGGSGDGNAVSGTLCGTVLTPELRPGPPLQL